ncbi:MAG: acetyltransferase [Fuerstiella sp.]|nr:acetyltransferase [Fuerstiella sp.]
MPKFFLHESSIVDDGAEVGAGTKIWHFSHVLSGAVIGCDCSFGQNTMVAGGVVVGDNVKVQNNVAIFDGTIVENDVFLGPSCVLTNVSNPRSQVVRHGLYEKTLIRRGATVGANSTVVCGVTLGRYSFIAAGCVVTKSIPDYAMIVGVPGKQVGWMSRHGHKLEFDSDGFATCPESNLRYQLQTTDCELRVQCCDLDEESELPERLANGVSRYREYKARNTTAS